jgi:predicted metal-dependent enzyme (double-stranded beta helix superfamily)
MAYAPPPTATSAQARLIDALDEAIASDRLDIERTVDSIRVLLARFVTEQQGAVPPHLTQVLPDRYARRELHHSEELGYSAVVMTWGPLQGTPIHDHCGMWCVEGVWSGCIEVVQYECLSQRDDRYHFESRGCMQACAGSAGSLIPPHEYHTIANPSPRHPAVTLHVYSGAMTRCNAFTPAETAPDGDDPTHWYRRTQRDLHFD